MSDIRKSTSSPTPTETERIPRPYSELTLTQQWWVDYKALNGLIVDRNTNAIRRMKVEELAQTLHVTRDALYKCVDYVPNFWDLVEERRKQLSKQNYLTAVYNAWFLMATSGKSWQATEAYIRNFGDGYKEPKQKHEVDIGDGLADALNLARQRKQNTGNVQEAEVIDAQP